MGKGQGQPWENLIPRAGMSWESERCQVTLRMGDVTVLLGKKHVIKHDSSGYQ